AIASGRCGQAASASRARAAKSTACSILSCHDTSLTTSGAGNSASQNTASRETTKTKRSSWRTDEGMQSPKNVDIALMSIVTVGRAGTAQVPARRKMRRSVMRPALRLSPQLAHAEAARSSARSAPRVFQALPARLHSMRLRALLFGTLLAAALVAGPVAARDLIVRTEAGSVKLTEVASGLQNPWSLAFLPDGRMLVTERPGQMRIVGRDGRVSAPIAGVPEVHARGQGGLLDVAVSPNFADDRLIVFSYAEPTAGGARTAVARARLDAEGLRLEDVRRIFAQNEDPSGNHHWGS